MGKKFSIGGVHLGMAAAPTGQEVPDKPPLRIVVLGDFSGRNGKGTRRTELNLRTRLIDRDNFDEVMAQLAPQAHGVPLTPEGATGSVEFSSLEQFHPDELLRRLPTLQSLRELRKRLADRNSFAAAQEEEARRVLQPPPAKEAKPAGNAPSSPSKPALNPAAEAGSFLDQVLAATEGQPPPSPTQVTMLKQLLQEVTAPYTIPADDPRQEPWLDAADQATAFALQRLVQAPAFRALEATWRGLDWLTKRVDADVEVKVAIVDLSSEELRADLAQDDLNESTLYELLAVRPKQQPDGAGWQVIVLDERLGSDIADIELIGRLSQLATDAGAKLLIGLTDEAVGCQTLGRAFVPGELSAPSEAWRFLQQLPDTAKTAALWPAFLLRQPYGKATNEVETVAFEELQGLEEPADALLWGNSAYLAADQLIRQRDEESAHTDISGLPCLVLPSEDGEKRLVPAAAWWLRDNTFDQLNALGVTPVCALTQAGTVRVFALRSMQGETL